MGPGGYAEVMQRRGRSSHGYNRRPLARYRASTSRTTRSGGWTISYSLYLLLVMEAAALVRRARTDAGLTQEQLARRLGVTQAALARLEKRDSNPTIATLDRVLRATGRRLDLRLGRSERSVDVTLLHEALRMTPAAGTAAAGRLLADAEAIAAAGARNRG